MYLKERKEKMALKRKERKVVETLREIKFRAWNVRDKMMISHNRLFRLDTSNELPFLPLLEKFTDDYEVMRYTGLKDKNGREIYEGDIVDFTYWWFDGNVAESHLIGEVVYLPEFMSFGLRGVKNADWIRHIGGDEGSTDTAPFATWTFDEADFEVISNIYENPTLLVGK